MISVLIEKQPEIARLCESHGIARLGVFGSAARETDFDDSTSDIDLLVTFAKPGQPGLSRRFVRFAEELEGLLAHSVDLVTQASIKDSGWKPLIKRDLEILHEAAA